jgi:hypothetical protein
LPWLRVQYAANGTGKESQVSAAASWICDASHIYPRAGELGFNSREALWGDLARVSRSTPYEMCCLRNEQAIVSGTNEQS